ncbi:MAG: UDP-glucose/GDP-mannose dehydrogenase family protein [Chloroflexota bacterium]|nr:MAG: UDP-glucose/GDP-mannose dehydrogenase family protein [Chloroflexota bacterium]
MANVCVIGAGYVGLTTGACFADLGNQVVCLDIDQARIDRLNQGELPIYEPGLEELVQRGVGAGRLTFSTDYAASVPSAEFIFIAVNTPQSAIGHADMTQVEGAAATLSRYLGNGPIIINKSTMPIGSVDRVADIIRHHTPKPFAVVSNPEFLREGSAVHDFLHPDRVVLGSTDGAAVRRVAGLYAPLNASIQITDPRTAEMIKYAANAFLATKISFINEIARICDRLGADVVEVARGMGQDPRIGSSMLAAGLGWGGSCFPKDVRALEYMASLHGAHPQLLRAVIEINRDQRIHAVRLVREAVGDLRGATIGLLGLSFKPNTDDMRDAPSLEIVDLLENEGAHVQAFDPAASTRAKALLPRVGLCSDPYAVGRNADAIILVTEWNEFKQIDLRRLGAGMKRRVLIDGRNLYDSAAARAAGFDYHAIGRPEAARTVVPVGS